MPAVYFELLIVSVTAGKATEVFMALFTASGNQHFFDNKGPDPTVRNRKSRLLILADIFL